MRPVHRLVRRRRAVTPEPLRYNTGGSNLTARDVHEQLVEDTAVPARRLHPGARVVPRHDARRRHHPAAQVQTVPARVRNLHVRNLRGETAPEETERGHVVVSHRGRVGPVPAAAPEHHRVFHNPCDKKHVPVSLIARVKMKVNESK